MDDVLQESAASQKPRGHLDPAGFDEHIQFHTYQPPNDLVPFLEHFWTLKWQEGDTVYSSEQVMHRPSVDVFVSKDWSGIQGTFRSKRTYVAIGSGRIIGARFLPGAFHVIWPGLMSELQDGEIPIQSLFTEMDTVFIHQLLTHDDQVIMNHFVRLIRAIPPRPDVNLSLINQIISRIESDKDLQTVSAIAQAYGKSERWLQQLFQNYIGIGLKWLLQRNKLLFAANRIRADNKPDWSAIAYEAGYSSQQHFITDFRRVLGKTPVQYKKKLTG